MSEIPRWEVGFSQMNEHDQGEFVTWNDHVVALKAARNELPDVGSWTPEPKFKVGDRVRNDMFIGTVTSIETYEDQENEFWVAWDEGQGQTQCDSRTLTLYVPPTPAELIPTLKEHEWVRGTYKTGTAFGPCTTYFNEIGAMSAGNNHLIHWNNGAISDELATLERCDPPVVK